MNRTMKEQKAATFEQRQQIKQLLAEEVVDAFAHAAGNLSYADAARLIAARHGQLGRFLEDGVEEMVETIGRPGNYVDQEIRTMEIRGYGPGYEWAKPIDEQLAILNRDHAKWGIKGEFTFTEEQRVLLQQMDPDHLEGIFLMPPRQLVDDNSYVAAVARMLENFWNISSLPFHLRGLEQTKAKVHRLKDEWQRQGQGNLTLVWAQLGALYAGKSAIRADELMLGPEEGGMGVYGLLALLTTHPERLAQSTDPVVICSGDEIPIPGSVVGASKVPTVSSFGNSLRFDITGWDDYAVNYMVASMLIPHKVD